MANAKISQLPAVTSAAGGDLAVAVASGTTSQITIDNLFKNRTMVAPALGTPASGTLTNCTGLPIAGIASLGTGVATALAQNVTGSGAIALATSPTFVTPTLGAASATTVNKVTITAPATGSTLTIADGKTLTASNTLTFTGTDASSVAFGTGGTVAYTSNKLSAFAATTSAELAGVISNETGSGSLVFGTGPTIDAPVLTLKAYTVGAGANQLPAAASSLGVVGYVTDATTPAVGSTVVGGGAAVAMVWSNGANWTVTGV